MASAISQPQFDVQRHEGAFSRPDNPIRPDGGIHLAGLKECPERQLSRQYPPPPNQL